MPSWRAASMRFVPGATSISLPSIVSFGIAMSESRPRTSVGGGLDGPLRDLPLEPDCAGQAGARTASPLRSCPNQRLELVAELFDVGNIRPDGAVVESADRGAGAALGHVEDRVEVLLATVAGQEALAHLVDPSGGLPARRALPARLVGVEARHHHQRLRDGYRLVEHDDAG